MNDEQFTCCPIRKTTLLATTETTVSPSSKRCRRYVILNEGTTNLRWSLGSAASTTGGLILPKSVLDICLGRKEWHLDLYLREQGGSTCDVSGFAEEKLSDRADDLPTYAFAGNVITPGFA